jgi:hypothetical protein
MEVFEDQNLINDLKKLKAEVLELCGRFKVYKK